jgi:hypothetical protein
MSTLPDKLSALIFLALRDLEAVEAQPQTYQVDMWNWHNPRRSGLCHVCFAGAVMANTLGVSPLEAKHAFEYPKEDQVKFRALNLARLGQWVSAFSMLGIHHDYDEIAAFLPRPQPYEEDPDHFKSTLYNVAHELEARGL